MEYVIAILIHIVIPFIGFIIFLIALRKYKPEHHLVTFQVKLLMLFSVFGGLLIVLLTSLFWVWSGLASVGAAFLFLVAPFIMLWIAYDSYKKSEEPLEKALFRIALSYYLFLPVVLLISFLVSN